MIGQLRGIIARVTQNHLIVDVSGVGYSVACAPRLLSRCTVGSEITVLTHTHIAETAFDLYGFEFESELVLFKQLISVSGVGPKSGLNIMNLGPVDAIAGAISRADITYLTKVSGIGRKIAERIVIDLKEKMGVIAEATTGSNGDRLGMVIDALVAMGYNQLDAREIVRGLRDVEKTAEELVRDALKMIHQRTK